MHTLAEHLCRLGRLAAALIGDRHLEAGIDDASIGLILEAAQQTAQDAKRRRDDAAGIPGVHPFAQHLDREVSRRHAPERGRAP